MAHTNSKNDVDAIQKTEKDKMHEKALESVMKLLNISEKYSSVWRNQFGALQSNGKNRKSSSNNGTGDLNFNNLSELKLDDFKGTLREYQIEGVTWMSTLFMGGINGILADEMGLGKTIQIIALIAHLVASNVSGPFLIVAPLSTLHNWKKEFEKFLPTLPVVVFHGNKEERQDLSSTIKSLVHQKSKLKPAVILSYQTVVRETQFLKSIKWKYNIIDEAQKIKNHKTQLSLALRELSSINKILLTGTPLQNNMTELWSLLNFIMPQIFKNVDTFSSLLAIEDFEDEQTMAEKNTIPIVNKIHKILQPFMLRRLKKNVLDDMVPKKEVIVYCMMADNQRKLYSKILNKTIDQIKKKESESEEQENIISNGMNLRKRKKTDYERRMRGEEFGSDDEEYDDEEESDSKRHHFDSSPEPKLFMDATNTQKIMKQESYKHHVKMTNPTMMYKRVVNHPYLISMPLVPGTREVIIDENIVSESGKMLVLDALLHKLKEQGHKVLIFSTLVVMLNIIEDYMHLRSYNYRRLDGGLDLQTRQQYVDDFNEDKDILAFLISTRAGGVGINLTSADTVIMFDNDWNPQADIQAQDRCHRIGQTKPVMIYTLAMKNTIDETIIKRGVMKRRLEKLVIKDRYQTQTFLQEHEAHARLLKSNIDRIVTHSNGFVLSDDELHNILDRSQLYEEMKESSKQTTHVI